jgi:hypothetical protein
MSRVVIEVHPGFEGQGFQVVLSEPETIAGGWVAREFPYNPADPIPSGFDDGRSTVSQVGEYLVEKLRSHPAVRQALDGLLAAAQGAAASPLYIRLTPDAEGLPWESLFDRNARFLALDRRWPVARMGREGGRRTPAIDFHPPLRVMAVLAAGEVDATDEWTGLYGSLQRATFPVALRVLVAQDDLHAVVGAAGNGNVAVSVGFVPPDRGLLDEIANFRPNVLHFFSHGRVAHGFPSIDIATRASWGDPDGRGRVVLDPASLGVQQALESVWVLTLNVCRGAQAGGAGSLVYSLLATGFPVVAGMREPVAERDAHAFCRGFYRSLVELIGQAPADGREIELDFAAALYEPRMEICEEHRGDASCLDAAAASREWTLPVLYVRHGGLAIRRRAPEPPPVVEQPAAPEEATDAELARATIQAKLGVLRDLLAAPLPGTDPRAIGAFRAEVARLESELYAQNDRVPA